MQTDRQTEKEVTEKHLDGEKGKIIEDRRRQNQYRELYMSATLKDFFFNSHIRKK